MKAKKGWFQSDFGRDTTGVYGSANQCHAAMAVQIDTTTRRTENNWIKKCLYN